MVLVSAQSLLTWMHAALHATSSIQPSIPLCFAYSSLDVLQSGARLNPNMQAKVCASCG